MELMAKTEQYFGSGASASRGVIVAADLANALIDGNVRGIEFRLVAA
jgi:hypothetical protein